jgi:hypothetical protein
MKYIKSLSIAILVFVGLLALTGVLGKVAFGLTLLSILFALIWGMVYGCLYG